MLQPWFPPEKLEIKYLCQNTHPAAIAIIERVLTENPITDKLDWNALCANPSAITLLHKQHNNCPNQINWSILSKNPAAIPLLYSDIYSRCSIDWKTLWANPSAIHILEKQDTKRYYFMYYDQLSKNPEGIPLLLKIQNKCCHNIIDWQSLSTNPSPLAINLLKENPEKISWPHLCANPSAMELILKAFEKTPKYIKWNTLSLNPSAADLLYKESKNIPNRLDWNNLCKNPNAIHILLENPEKINWYCLSTNPSIFQNEDYCIK